MTKLNMKNGKIFVNKEKKFYRISYRGQFDPRSKSHGLCPNMTNDTSLESSSALLLESANKFANLRKLNFLSQNPVL